MNRPPLPPDILALAYRHARSLHDRAIGEAAADLFARLAARMSAGAVSARPRRRAARA